MLIPVPPAGVCFCSHSGYRNQWLYKDWFGGHTAGCLGAGCSSEPCKGEET